MDDQLLRWVLAATSAHSEIAQKILEEGAMPLFGVKPHLQKTFLPDLNFRFRKSGMYKSTFAIDPKRFHRSITSIVRGLWYHHTWYSHKALGPMEISWAALTSKQSALQALGLSDLEYSMFTKPLPNQPEYTLGENPEVFRYGFDLKSDPGHIICILRFYEGEAIYVRWQNGKREYSTNLKSLIEYMKTYREISALDPTEYSDEQKKDLIRRLDESDTRLTILQNDAKRCRDFSAFKLVKMMIADNAVKRGLCVIGKNQKR